MPVDTATALENLKSWLSTYPHWDDPLLFSYVAGRPANAGLLPQGLEETSRREDVLGNLQVGYRYRFALYWKMAGQGEDAENAGRLLDFQQWVREQSRLGLAPHFGDVPANEKLWTEKGGLTAGAQIVTYTATLVADFMKVYEVK